MELFLHVGIYKTGSSFLQSILTINRQSLINQSIYFPYSKHDERMKQGIISPGNALALSLALRKDDRDKVRQLLKIWMHDAEKNACTKILLSAEDLVHPLSFKFQVELLKTEAIKLGFTVIKVFAFIRELSDHALSTFKHRAKYGAIPDFKQWVDKRYETPLLLDRLIKVKADTPEIQWTLTYFKKNQNDIKASFFKDWLKCEIPENISYPKVNESLTISEIKLIETVKHRFPNVLDYFVNDFTGQSSEKKCNDKINNEMYKEVARQLLSKYNTILFNLRNLIPDYPEVEGEAKITTDLIKPCLNLSPSQYNIFLKRCLFFQTPYGRLIRIKRWIVKFVFTQKSKTFVELES